MKRIVIFLFVILLTLSSCEDIPIDDLELVDQRLIGKWYLADIPGGKYIEFTPSSYISPYGFFDKKSYYSKPIKTSDNSIFSVNSGELKAYYEFVIMEEFDFEIESAKYSGDKWLLYQLTRKKLAASNGNMCRLIIIDDYNFLSFDKGTYELFRWDLVSPDIYIDE